MPAIFESQEFAALSESQRIGLRTLLDSLNHPYLLINLNCNLQNGNAIVRTNSDWFFEQMLKRLKAGKQVVIAPDGLPQANPELLRKLRTRLKALNEEFPHLLFDLSDLKVPYVYPALIQQAEDFYTPDTGSAHLGISLNPAATRVLYRVNSWDPIANDDLEIKPQETQTTPDGEILKSRNLINAWARRQGHYWGIRDEETWGGREEKSKSWKYWGPPEGWLKSPLSNRVLYRCGPALKQAQLH